MRDWSVGGGGGGGELSVPPFSIWLKLQAPILELPQNLLFSPPPFGMTKTFSAPSIVVPPPPPLPFCSNPLPVTNYHSLINVLAGSLCVTVADPGGGGARRGQLPPLGGQHFVD